MKKRIIFAGAVVVSLIFSAFSAMAGDHLRLNLDLSVADRKDGEQKSLMLGNREIFTDVTYGINIAEVAIVENNYVVLIGLNSGGVACPMQFRFVTIPMDYDGSTPTQPVPTASGESWWQRSYHWVLSLMGFDMAPKPSRITETAPVTSGGIMVSDEFGTCSDEYILMLSSQSYRTRMTVYSGDRRYDYIPDSTKVSESIVR